MTILEYDKMFQAKKEEKKKTVIENAKQKISEYAEKQDTASYLYWRAYLDGAEAQKKEI